VSVEAVSVVAAREKVGILTSAPPLAGISGSSDPFHTRLGRK
jgi:hypothetical protein